MLFKCNDNFNAKFKLVGKLFLLEKFVIIALILAFFLVALLIFECHNILQNFRSPLTNKKK